MSPAFIARVVVAAYGHRDALNYCADRRMEQLSPRQSTAEVVKITDSRQWILWQDVARFVPSMPTPLRISRPRVQRASR